MRLEGHLRVLDVVLGIPHQERLLVVHIGEGGNLLKIRRVCLASRFALSYRGFSFGSTMRTMNDGCQPTRPFGGSIRVLFYFLGVVMETRDLLKVPEENLPVGIAESENRVLVWDEVQLESHEKLWTTTGSRELHQTGVRCWAFGRDAWVEGGPRQIGRVDGGGSHVLRRPGIF